MFIPDSSAPKTSPSMNILEQIIAERQEDVAAARGRVSAADLREQASAHRPRSLRDPLAGPGTHIIAEMKKASPSAGPLREEYHPREIAAAYEGAGAVGLSVLTEPRHFMGSGDHLAEASSAVSIPVLRKDFICDPYQVYEAAAWGADVVLLIAAALDPGQMRDLYEEALACGLDVLAETHTEAEIETVLSLDEAIVGVNSRDLKTLTTDLAVARSLAEEVPAGRLSVAESGIRTRQDIVELQACGYNGFLVGETLMSAGDPAEALRGLIGP